MFRQIHIFAEKNSALQSVTTTVIPYKGESSDYADDGVTISVALNAEVRKPVDSERKALGMSLLLRHAGGLWVVEAEIGWSGQRVGWDPFDAKEMQATSIEEVFKEAPSMVEWMELRFREEVEKLVV